MKPIEFEIFGQFYQINSGVERVCKEDCFGYLEGIKLMPLAFNVSCSYGIKSLLLNYNRDGCTILMSIGRFET